MSDTATKRPSKRKLISLLQGQVACLRELVGVMGGQIDELRAIVNRHDLETTALKEGRRAMAAEMRRIAKDGRHGTDVIWEQLDKEVGLLTEKVKSLEVAHKA